MNPESGAVDQVMRAELMLTETAIRLAASGAVQLAGMLVAILRNEKQISGKTDIIKMIQEGKPITAFPLEAAKMKDFSDLAKQYGTLLLGKADIRISADRRNVLSLFHSPISFGSDSIRKAVFPLPQHQKAAPGHGNPGRVAGKVVADPQGEPGGEGAVFQRVVQPFQGYVRSIAAQTEHA